jgi:hypothetical protein
LDCYQKCRTEVLNFHVLYWDFGCVTSSLFRANAMNKDQYVMEIVTEALYKTIFVLCPVSRAVVPGVEAGFLYLLTFRVCHFIFINWL